MFFVAKFYIGNLQSLLEWGKFENKVLNKIKSARDTFLNNLNSIYQKEFEQIQNERRKKMLKTKFRIDKSKSKAKIFEAVQLADILTKIFYRRVSFKLQFNNYKIRLGAGKSYFSKCAVQDCMFTKIHHVKKLHR